jgi:Transposase IS66 family
MSSCRLFVKEGTGKRTSGNTVGQTGQSCSIFRLGREREGPKRFLGNFEGILQSDGYGAYARVGEPGMVHAGCWAHARRKFFDAVKPNPKDRLR